MNMEMKTQREFHASGRTLTLEITYQVYGIHKGDIRRDKVLGCSDCGPNTEW